MYLHKFSVILTALQWGKNTQDAAYNGAHMVYMYSIYFYFFVNMLIFNPNYPMKVSQILSTMLQHFINDIYNLRPANWKVLNPVDTKHY